MSPNTKKLLITLGGIDALLLVFAALAVFGLVVKHNSTVEAELKLGEEKAKLASIQSIGKMLDDTKDSREYLSGLFIDKQSLVDFLESLEAIGVQSRAKVTVDDVLYPEGANPGKVATIRFTAIGTWPQIAKTIALADHIPIAAAITSVQVVKYLSNESVSPPTVALEDPKKSVGDAKKAPPLQYWRAAFEVKVLIKPEKL